MSAQRQSSVLLLSTLDQLQCQAFNIEEVLRGAHLGAVRPPGYRNSFQVLDSPIKEMLGDINPLHSGFLFPGSELVKPDLSAYLSDVPEEVRQQVLIAVDEAHEDNTAMMRALDSKIRSLTSAASCLVNHSAEAIAGYGRLTSALDVCQLGILRRHVGAFVRPRQRRRS